MIKGEMKKELEIKIRLKTMIRKTIKKIGIEGEVKVEKEETIDIEMIVEDLVVDLTRKKEEGEIQGIDVDENGFKLN